MFHVNDDFDFDDDLVDGASAESDVRDKIDDGSNKSFTECKIPKLANAETRFFDYTVKNIDSTRPELSTRQVKTVRQRKFPGPAGLLPERQGNTSLIATEEFLSELNSEDDDSSNFKEKDVLSQNSGHVFESGAWNAMVEDLGTAGKALTSLMNLSSLRLKHIKGYKVPFLAVIINNIDCTLPDPTIVVKDPTDEMHGMLHREVWEKFNTEMLPGSVLVLKNVGVISAGTTSRRHVLNITTNNLTAIYSNRQEEHVQIRKISEFPNGDLTIVLNEWEKLISTPTILDISKPKNMFGKSLAEQTRNASHPFRSPASSLSPHNPMKSYFVRRQLVNNHNQVNSKTQSSSLTEQPYKKRKNVPAKDLETCRPMKNQTCQPPLQKNPFTVDSDTSMVDSLLDGIDTNSLFEEF